MLNAAVKMFSFIKALSITKRKNEIKKRTCICVTDWCCRSCRIKRQLCRQYYRRFGCSVKQNDTAVYPAGEGTSSSNGTTEVSTEPIQEDKVVHVLAAGDNLIHYSVYKNAEAYAENGEAYNFAPIYENVRYLVESADVAILNQETIISESNEVRGANGGALLFNSPPEVADAVIDLGFDVFTMANNHLLDFGASALEESINFWNQKAEENDLTVLGAYLNEEDANNIRVREVNGVKIAFLAYAEHINGFDFPYDSPLRVVMNYEEMLSKDR